MNVRSMLTNAFDRNVGGIDRIIRGLLALSVPILYVTGQIEGIAAITLAVLAALILRTSVTGVTPQNSVDSLALTAIADQLVN